MMQQWTAQNVAFMRDASVFHPDYYRQLAQRVVQCLGTHNQALTHLCDAGCGEGDLSLALAPYCKQITAVDIHPAPLAVLRQSITDIGVKNVTVRCGDIHALPPEQKYSAMVFCYFGTMPEPLRIAKAQCSGTLVIVTRNYTEHRFTPGGGYARRDNVPTSRSVLTQLGIAFSEQTCALEFGQPFRSMDDAMRFFEIYNADAAQKIDRAQVAARLIPTQRTDFPLYLPVQKKLGILSLRVQDIPEEL